MDRVFRETDKSYATSNAPRVYLYIEVLTENFSLFV